jgi:TolB-like protein
VLPFVNRSRDEEDEYFSDGLADELLNMLAKIRGLRVAARTSSFTFKGKEATIADVGHALNVATVLEGSVRRAGRRVRIAVQLIKVSDGYHLWSEIYDRTLEDIFAVQDDIAQSVVKELRTTLLGIEVDSRTSVVARDELAAAAKGRGTNAEAHRLFLQARHFIDRRSPDDTARGIGYLMEALELEPSFAMAWVELSRAHSGKADMGWVPVAEGYGRARQAAEHALSLQPDLAEAHAQMGSIQRAYDWDWHGAEASIRRAQDLAPGNAAVLRQAAIMARCLGRSEEAIVLLRRALEQDPLSGSTYNALGWALHAANRLPESEAAYRKALELAPQRVYTRALLAMALLSLGRADEALAVAIEEPDEAFRLWALSIVHHAAGRPAESDEAARELIGKHAEGVAFQIAEMQAARGRTDSAFEWLERAHAQRDGGLTDVKTNPRFRPLHGDARWSAFLMKMRLAD